MSRQSPHGEAAGRPSKQREPHGLDGRGVAEPERTVGEVG